MRTVFDGSEVPLISIKFKVGVLQYCPLFVDMTIALPTYPTQTIDYCPQNTTGFYTFDNPP